MAHTGEYEPIVRAAERISEVTGGFAPDALVQLGSGLGHLLDEMEIVAELPFGELPGFASSGVVGHAGRFVFGRLGETRVMAMMGRLHLYEGHPASRVVLPVRVAKLLGCRVLLATNAAGGIAPRLSVGQSMLVTDHINLMGVNPLTGPNVDALGPRFPLMTDAYSERLATAAREVADGIGADLAEGVYAAVLGPNYETRAEIRALHHLGADAVGMSTVPEVLVARHAGMEVAALSLIANVAGEVVLSHEEVLRAAELGAPVLGSLVAGILTRL